MSSHSASDWPGEPPDFLCDWSPAGTGAAAVRVGGELDSITAPQLQQVLDEALDHAQLILVNLREVSFVDSTGLRLLLDATRRSREGHWRLVLVGASAPLERLFALTATRSFVHALPAPPRTAATAVPAADGGIDPLSNPVNARIITARVMDIDDRALWAHSTDGAIRRVWAPTADRSRLPAGAKVEVYLDHRGTINGWWLTGSRLAINQRHLDTVDDEPETAPALACQGLCELLWQAPAAAHVLDHEERCLTCAGALALV
ncbi:STAS domain-containing protein [Solirubrobacter taibaiensis]|nr:STAS domain-containing protein [Solirubrobacter taibaiensis]